MEGLLGLSLQQQYEGQAAPLLVLKVAAESGFQLRKRALHVFSEARRVLQFADFCRDDSGSTSTVQGKLVQLAQLMDDSHASCRDLYECSCPELEELVTMAKACGALGGCMT